MTVNVLFAAKAERWREYEAPLNDALQKAGVDANLSCDHAPGSVDYIVYAPNSDVQDFTPFTRLKAVLNLWAGVESVAPNKTLTVPLARMVDHGLTQGMIEWVTGHVLRHHLGMDAHIINPEHKWELGAPPLANDRRVTILGLGELGMACAQTLRMLGFDVAGWSRSPKSLDGIPAFHGPDGLKTSLARADIAVLLLPLTEQTENTLDTAHLAMMPTGSMIINPGRGGLIDDDALLAALDAGQIAHATLDVFRVEPLPADHPYWEHPQVTVTPHIASETRKVTASQCVAENVRRGEAGEPFLHLVDRNAGY